MEKINTIEGLNNFIQAYGGSERDLNRHLLERIKVDKLDLDVFLEYLEITQSDVRECMEEGLR